MLYIAIKYPARSVYFTARLVDVLVMGFRKTMLNVKRFR
jgi:hypothetical protein